jgi:hypothetical protein
MALNGSASTAVAFFGGGRVFYRLGSFSANFERFLAVELLSDLLIEAEDNIALKTQAYDFAARVAECTSLTAKEIFVHNLVEFAVTHNAV